MLFSDITAREDLLKYLQDLSVFTDEQYSSISPKYSGFSNLRNRPELVNLLKKLTNLQTNNLGELLYRLVHPNSGYCPFCHKPLKFYNYKTGYSKTCGDKDCLKKSREQVCLQKYGVPHQSQSVECKNKIIATSLKKYGTVSYFQTNSFKQQSKETCLRKYQVENYSQTQECKDKVKQTFLKRYHKENYSQTEDFKKKAKETSLHRYGVSNYSQTQECKEKVTQSNRKKFGADYFTQTPEYLAKRKQTSLNTYGVPDYSQSEEFKKKIRDTNTKRYGTPYYSQTSEFKEKIRNTSREKYGVDSYFQSKEFSKKSHDFYQTHFGVDCYSQTKEAQKYHRVCYKISAEDLKSLHIDSSALTSKNFQFSSSWELIFWMYHVLGNIPIECISQGIEYSVEDKIHYYFPDFKIGDQYYEIKGDQFLDKNGSLKNPFTDDPFIQKIYEAKSECMRKYKVILIAKKDIGSYREFTEQKLGKCWWEKFTV